MKTWKEVRDERAQWRAGSDGKQSYKDGADFGRDYEQKRAAKLVEALEMVSYAISQKKSGSVIQFMPFTDSLIEKAVNDALAEYQGWQQPKTITTADDDDGKQTIT